jgi:hypothetical protein
MGRLVDITGKRFNRWQVLALQPERSRWGEATWLCRCDCGTECVVTGRVLRDGRSTSCGCFNREQVKARSTKHGHARGGKLTSAYARWIAMKQRCFNPNNRQYCNYGARGITVRDPWLRFEDYYAETGEPPPGKSLDRIDNDGDYGPGNWQWATRIEQNLNRRSRKRKRRPAALEDIQAYAAALARAAGKSSLPTQGE